MGQILTNLANNAVKFTREGHIFINTTLVSEDDESIRLKFSVKDTGIGISKEHMDKLFKAFTQADTSMTRKFGGTGLGLSISNRLVELMDGELTVISEAGEGSDFTFTITVLKQNVKEEAIQAPQNIYGKRVLVVDDNAIAREILTQQLTFLGFRVQAVDSGQKALEVLENNKNKEPYALVFMDWRMPEMDGLMTAQNILKNNNLGHPPLIIMVTAFGREKVMEAAEDIGIDGFLMKPVNPTLIYNAVMDVFNKKQIKT